jgi:hypothetical protein
MVDDHNGHISFSKHVHLQQCHFETTGQKTPYWAYLSRFVELYLIAFWRGSQGSGHLLLLVADWS